MNSKVRYSQIYDGSSQTLLIGEAFTAPDRLGWVSGTRATLRNTSAIEPAKPYLPSTASTNAVGMSATYVGGFGSHHPGGMNANFADGSTRFLTQTISREVLHQIGNRADGEIPKEY